VEETVSPPAGVSFTTTRVSSLLLTRAIRQIRSHIWQHLWSTPTSYLPDSASISIFWWNRGFDFGFTCFISFRTSEIRILVLLFFVFILTA